MKRYVLALAAGSLAGVIIGAAAFLVKTQLRDGQKWERL